MNNEQKIETIYKLTSQGLKTFNLAANSKIPNASYKWKERASNDPLETIQELTTNGGNIAVMTGYGLVVIDIDNKQGKNGLEWFKKWLHLKSHDLDKLLNTYTIETTNGGYHYYFKTHKDYKNSVNAKFNIDIRGIGGYVVAENSTINGKTYKVINDAPIMEIPAEVEQFIEELQNRPQETHTKPIQGESVSSGLFTLPVKIVQGERDNVLFRYACSLRERGGTYTDILKTLESVNHERVSPPLEITQIKKIARQACQYEPNKRKKGQVHQPMHNNPYIERLKALSTDELMTLGTDETNARLFAKVASPFLRFNLDIERYMAFNGKFWQRDSKKEIEANRHSMLFLDALKVMIQSIYDPHKRETLQKSIKGLKSNRGREAMLKDAKSLLQIKLSSFDAHLFKINCNNGTYNLLENTHTPHNPSDYISKMANVEYKPELGKEGLFLNTVRTVLQHDQPTIDYLLKVFAYCITGDVKHEKLFILYGASTRNGKSTLIGAVMEMLSTGLYGYSATLSPSILSTENRRTGNDAQPEIAKLVAVRLAQVPEPSSTMTLNEATVKTMTGGDRLTCRETYGHPFEFEPQVKMILNTNHLPIVNDITVFTSDRVVVIPFNKHFTEKEQDKELKRKLKDKDELSKMLNVLIEYHKRLLVEGLDNPPDKVLEATKAYEQKSDLIGLYISDRLQHTGNPNDYITLKQVTHDMYKWSMDNRRLPPTKTEIKEKLNKKGLLVIEKATKMQGKPIRNFIREYLFSND